MTLARRSGRRVHATGGIRAALACAILAGGCSSGGGRTAVIDGADDGLRLLPSPTTVTMQLAARLEVTGVDPAQCRYAWRINGHTLAGSTSDRLDPQVLRKGDLVAVEVTLPAPVGGPPRTLRAETRVQNAPPVVRGIRLVADESEGGHELVASAECWDPDADAVSCAYRWLRNGQEIDGADGASLPVPSFARDDRIEVEVVADDGQGRSEPRRSAPFAIENRAPRFPEQAPEISADADGVSFRVAATDADGDSLHYEVVEGPAGLTVTRDGAVHWPSPLVRVSGLHRVTIRASDGRGGSATQELTLRRSSGSTKPS
jgi:hypothetical protein